MKMHDYVNDLKDLTDIGEFASSLGLHLDEHGQTSCFVGHDENTPSLTFYEDSQRYFCFGCGKQGDVIDLAKEVLNCLFPEALNTVADFVGMEHFRGSSETEVAQFAEVRRCLNAAAKQYHEWVKDALPYLKGRGISSETAKKLMVGCTRGINDLREALEAQGFDRKVIAQAGLLNCDGDYFRDRIIFPIVKSGSAVNFCGRTISEDSSAKYLMLSNQRLVVGDAPFNWNLRWKEIILVEGIFDALSLIQAGFDNTMALLGTHRLSDELVAQVKRSRVERVFVCYDNDESGRKAALRDSLRLEDAGKSVQVVSLPVKDPNEYLEATKRKNLPSCSWRRKPRLKWKQIALRQ